MTEQPKIRRLRKLVANEVSLVNRGAIRRPFLVIKNEDGTMPTDAILPMPTAAQEAKIDAVIAKRAQVVRKATDATDAATLNEAPQDGNSDEAEALDERSMAALKAVYRILLPFKGKLSEADVDDVLAELDLDDTGDDGQDDAQDGDVDDVDASDDLQPEEDQAMAKGDFDPESLKKAATDWSPSKPADASDEDHSKAMQAAKDAYAKCIGKAADDDDEDEEDDDDVKKSAVSKAALPAHAELVAKAEAEKKEWIAKAADLEARLGRMESERILKSHEDNVRKDCQVLGKDPAAVARIIKGQYDASKEAGDAYVELLRESAKLTHQSGIFKSVGTSSNAGFGAYVPSEGQGSPRQQLEAMVKGLVQKGESKDESAAWTTVLNTQRGQELYAAGHGSSH